MTLTLAGTVAGRSANVRRLGSGLRLWAVAAVCLWAMVSTAGAQQLFKTPDDAAKALAEAAKSGDVRAVMRVLGNESAELASSGDQVADAATRKQFFESYETKHRIAMDGEDKAVLMVGEGDWPFPIPLIRRNETWRFDAAAGRQEILQRRIGRNELSAIQACRAYVDAQHEYADQDRTGTGVGVYAPRFLSRPGKKDGLYWPTQAGDKSPLGELVARASAEGYRVGGGRQPFHGYYYKILTRQGPNARGGAMDYIVKGRLIGGFALVAYPAEYDNSGVMTFIVNQDGVVYEKDLGPNTLGIASNMTAFDPDQTWRKVVNDGIPQAASAQ
jgi:DUF2950 family protein